MKWKQQLLVAGLAALSLGLLGAGRGGNPRGPAPVFYTEVPEHALDVILARPGADTITLSVLSYRDLQGNVAYGSPNVLSQHTALTTFAADEPRSVVLTGLQPDAAGAYELRSSSDQVLAAGTFHTQRQPGSRFIFTITADSHLDDRTNTRLYAATLRNALADHPDFNVDLGDTFMTEKYPGDFHAARSQYLAQRYYFGLLCGSTPLLLTLGNHDGELGWLLDGTPHSMPVWSCRQRQRYFPNPEPGGIYTGNDRPEPHVGLLQNYYAWEWGDALFVVLDSFWPTRTKPSRGDGGWARTLGEAQYHWLERTLQASRAPLKFVFVHHLVGGSDQNGRGGVEAVPFFEWGGLNADGSEGFTKHRPGWTKPIHDLLRQHAVTAVFHGHDHFYARQELDGIVYQLVPQPGHSGRRNTGPAASYGYRSGDLVEGSGYLRVAVEPEGAEVSFVRSVLPDDERGDQANGQVVADYRLASSAVAN